MTPDGASRSPVDNAHIINWLDEQRRVDHETLIDLTRAVTEIRDEVTRNTSLLSRLLTVESRPDTDASRTSVSDLNALKEHIALIQEAVGRHIEDVTQASRVRESERERDLRQFGELYQRLGDIQRVIEGTDQRTLALGEQVRRERDERTPLVEAVDRLQSDQFAIRNRLTILDELTRRTSNFQNVVERNDEERRVSVTRVEEQVKLLDLRLTREIADATRSAAELATRTDEQVKPVTWLAKNVAAAEDHLHRVEEHMTTAQQEIEALGDEIGRLEARQRTDRDITDRLAATSEAQSRRIEEAVTSTWQLAERVSTSANDVGDLRTAVAALTERIEQLERRITRLESERQKVDTANSTIETDLRAFKRDFDVAVDDLRRYVDSVSGSLRDQVDDIKRLALAQRRRSLAELQLQLNELESDDH